MGIKVCCRELRRAMHPPSLPAFVPLKRTLITTCFVFTHHNLFIIIWDDWIQFKVPHCVQSMPLYGSPVFPKLEVYNFFFLWRNNPTRAYATSLLQFLDRTKIITHTRWDTYEREISSSQRQTSTLQKKNRTSNQEICENKINNTNNYYNSNNNHPIIISYYSTSNINLKED
jgi:hypothetical protein